jgi:hypothetical protein
VANRKISDLPQISQLLPGDLLLVARPSTGENFAFTQQGLIAMLATGGAPAPSSTGTLTLHFTVSFQDANLIANSNLIHIPLFTLPGMAKILGVTVKHSAAWNGPANQAVQVSIGSFDGSYYNDTAYAPMLNVTAAPASDNYLDSVQYQSMIWDPHQVFAVLSGLLPFGNGLNTQLTSGSVDVWITYVQLSQS